MYRVTREIDFCYGHRLLNYDGKCRYLHGHNGRAVITLEGPALDARGMLIDFGEIKQKVQCWIDDNLDHNMLLCREDPILPILQARGERVFVMDRNPTAENIARLIWEHATSAGLPVVEVVLWETEHCFAAFTRSDPGAAQE
jgi:6-pyruvoyltetrahydropterin/6-carboxytetrahydropterin synthase